ncbi:hypothetical protein ACIOD2_16640 [Amycolatopsis sp. NPDC088138]|uniref:hypothetical protein n=1 Tax=Amycolatopsis sp. NPDC088138 TaxID=3363938 RepID=UPI00380444DA
MRAGRRPAAPLPQISFGIFVFLVMPLVAFVLGCVDLAIGLPVLRPSPRTIQRYAR